MEAMMRELQGAAAAGAPTPGVPPGAGGEPSEEELMALLHMFEQNPDSAPPELAELMKSVRQQKGQATAADKLAQGQDIIPEPGFVIKTADDGGRKVFINICGSSKVAPPGAKWENGQVPEAVQKALDQGDSIDEAGQAALRCPISLGEPRVDMDRKGDSCAVFDCVLNDEVCATASKGHRQLKNFIIELAMGWIQHKHKLVLDPKYKLPRMKYKGEQVASMRIRVDKKNLVEEVPDDTPDEPVFPLVTKPIPATVPRPPPELHKGERAAAGKGAVAEPRQAATSTVGGEAKSSANLPASSSSHRLVHEVTYSGTPAEMVEILLRVPEGAPAIDAATLTVEVLAETVLVQPKGYAQSNIKLPFAVSSKGADAILSDGGLSLCLTLPFRPFQEVLDEMKEEAPHQFGDLSLTNTSILELEP